MREPDEGPQIMNEFDKWLATHRATRNEYGSHYETDEAIEEAWLLTRRLGPHNCWTGDSGAMASAIVGLILEVDRLRREIK